MSYRALKISGLVTACGLILAIAIAPMYIPEQKYHSLIEHLISEGLDRQVKISKLKYELFPLPHIEGTNITIMSNKHTGEAVIGQLSIWFSYSELLKGQLQLQRLHFNGVATNQTFIESFAANNTATNETPNRLINIKHITASSVSIRSHDNTLIGPFRFDGEFNTDQAFTFLKVSLIDNDLQLTITPASKQRMQMEISGSNLSFPQYTPLSIDTLSASAFYQDGMLNINRFDIQAYEGQIKGKFTLQKEHDNKEWVAAGNLNINTLQIASINQLLKPTHPPSHSPLHHPFKVSGQLNGTFDISSRAASPLELLTSSHVKGRLTINNGRLQSPQSNIAFDTLTTSTNITSSQAHFEQLHAQLYGGILSDGSFTIQWGKIWKLKGKGASSNIDFAPLITGLFNEKSTFAGKLTAAATFSANADTAPRLAKNLHLQGNFELTEPTITFSQLPSTRLDLQEFSSIRASDFKLAPELFSANNLIFTGYKGVTEANNFHLTWPKPWHLKANITTKQVSLQPLLHQLGQKKYISGQLDSTFTLKANAPSLASIMDHIDIAGEFEVQQGSAQLSTTKKTEPNKTFKFNNAQARAFYDKQNLLITSLNINAYDGNIHIKDFHLKNNETWKLYCEINADNIDLEPFLRDTSNQHILAGKAGLHTTLSLNAAELEALTTNINADGSFYVNDGIVFNTDIEHAAAITSVAHQSKEATLFSELSSRFEIISNTITLSKLKITSTNLTGKGDLVIDTDNNIEGTLDVALRSTGGLLKVPLNVSGTIDEPEFSLTGGALVGSAVGTSVLGPGLGTFVGLQTGKIFTGIGNLFSRDKK